MFAVCNLAPDLRGVGASWDTVILSQPRVVETPECNVRVAILVPAS